MIKVKIKDIVDIFNGSTPSTSVSENFDGHISWITPKDISDQKTKYINRGERNITEKGLNSIGGNLLPKGTILFSSRAPIGLMSICTKETATNQGFKNMVCKKDKIDNEYLFYLLKTQISKIQELGTGTTFKEVSKSTIESFEIYIEENVPTQQKIAAVLSALDDKIEVNNKINAALEAMAKTLYDYWFVQFEFPITNESHPELVSGSHPKGYKSAGGKMVYNKTLKREIPEGWEVKSLYSIADFINGLACQKYRPENESDDFLPVIKIREMNDGISSNTEKVKIDIPEKNKIDDGDILFSWSATLDVKIWTQGKGGLNQHIFKVISKDYPKSFYYFELLNYLEHFKMMAELRKTTMGHITIDHLKTSLIAIPSKELILKMDTKLTPILNKIISNKKQNQELAQLRDWLLPMLMNGQVTVGEALEATEKQLAMVAEPSVDYKIKDDIKENRFALWLSNQKLAARGDIDEVVLREIFDAMDDEDQ